MSRIKYKKTPSGNLCSQLFVTKTGNLIWIFINSKTLEYFIFYEKNKESIKCGEANSLVSLKKKARAAVKELGVNFVDEVKTRGKVEKFEI
jgi:hypothetical protein